MNAAGPQDPPEHRAECNTDDAYTCVQVDCKSRHGNHE